VAVRQAALVSDESALEACLRRCAIQIDDLYLYELRIKHSTGLLVAWQGPEGDAQMDVVTVTGFASRRCTLTPASAQKEASY